MFSGKEGLHSLHCKYSKMLPFPLSLSNCCIYRMNERMFVVDWKIDSTSIKSIYIKKKCDRVKTSEWMMVSFSDHALLFHNYYDLVILMFRAMVLGSPASDLGMLSLLALSCGW